MNQFPQSFLTLIWPVSCRTPSFHIFCVCTHFKHVSPPQDTQPFRHIISLCCYLQIHTHFLPNSAQYWMLIKQRLWSTCAEVWELHCHTISVNTFTRNSFYDYSLLCCCMIFHLYLLVLLEIPITILLYSSSICRCGYFLNSLSCSNLHTCLINSLLI